MTSETSPFVPGQSTHIEGAETGPLAGMTFAAKDLFDVAGHRTGAGNPDWGKDTAPPSKHAWAVQTLLDAGATLIGKTITDEVSLGLLGENAFDGTPLNPRAPDRVPGGSSSGSASAVAQGLCDVAIGTDTGGSVRVPASFCGLYGIRPTHGRLPLDGMLPQAPTSDTTGWFARDAETFARVSAVLLGEDIPSALPDRLVIATDAFGFADAEVQTALRPAVEKLSALIGPPQEALLAPQGLSTWGRAQRTLQLAEAWETFRPWVERDNPRFAFLVARTLLTASATSKADLIQAALMRDEVRARLNYLMPPGTIVCMPTTPIIAPLKNQPLPVLDRARDRINCMAAHGGLAGHPQLSLPLGEVNGAPVGLSILAARGADSLLVNVAKQLEETE